MSNRLTTCQDPPEIDVRRGRMGRSRSAGAGADRRSNQGAGLIPMSPCAESSQFQRFDALVKRFDSANVPALSSRALYEHSISAGLCAGRDLSTSSACNRRFQAMNHRDLCDLDGLSNRLTTRLAPSKRSRAPHGRPLSPESSGDQRLTNPRSFKRTLAPTNVGHPSTA